MKHIRWVFGATSMHIHSLEMTFPSLVSIIEMIIIIIISVLEKQKYELKCSGISIETLMDSFFSLTWLTMLRILRHQIFCIHAWLFWPLELPLLLKWANEAEKGSIKLSIYYFNNIFPSHGIWLSSEMHNFIRLDIINIIVIELQKFHKTWKYVSFPRVLWFLIVFFVFQYVSKAQSIC